MNIEETYIGTVTLKDQVTGGRRPVILFPDSEPARLAWNADEVADSDIGSIPLYVAEHYIFRAIYSDDDAVHADSLTQFPFTRISSIDTPAKVKDWRDSYYLKSALCPFGYRCGDRRRVARLCSANTRLLQQTLEEGLNLEGVTEGSASCLIDGRVEDWRGIPKVQPSRFSPFPLGVPQ